MDDRLSVKLEMKMMMLGGFGETAEGLEFLAWAKDWCLNKEEKFN